jgi:hypothetical protein
MGLLTTIMKWAVLLAAVYFLFKIVRALIREPNLRLYLVHTAKDLKNMYYRYHV